MLQLLSAIDFPQIDPEIVRIGPFALRWYGLAYIAGFVTGYLLMVQLARRGVVRMAKQEVADLVGWLVLGLLLGARLGWWIFYHRDPGEPEPWYEPIAVWHGGMSFHGGLAGIVLVLILWCWRKKQSFLNLADGMALVAPAGLFFGRIANFINAELVGRPSDVPWAVNFPDYAEPRHPSQLYEALLQGPVLMALVWFVLRFRPRDGSIAATFMMGYGVLRFLVEFTREPDVEIGFIAFGWLTMGQLLSALLFAAGLTLLLYRVLAKGVSSAPTEPPKQRASR